MPDKLNQSYLGVRIAELASHTSVAFKTIPILQDLLQELNFGLTHDFQTLKNLIYPICIFFKCPPKQSINTVSIMRMLCVRLPKVWQGLLQGFTLAAQQCRRGVDWHEGRRL